MSNGARFHGAISSAPGSSDLRYTATAPPSFAVLRPHGVTARRNGAGRRARGVRLPTRRRHAQLADREPLKPPRPSGGRHGEAAVGPPGRRRHRGGIERRRFLICPGVSTWALGPLGSVLAPALQSGFDRKVAKVRKRGSAPAGRSVTAGRERRMASGWAHQRPLNRQAEGSGAASSTTTVRGAWHRGGRMTAGLRGPARAVSPVRRTRPRSQRHVPCLRRGSSSCLVASISRLRARTCACLPG